MLFRSNPPIGQQQQAAVTQEEGGVGQASDDPLAALEEGEEEEEEWDDSMGEDGPKKRNKVGCVGHGLQHSYYHASYLNKCPL